MSTVTATASGRSLSPARRAQIASDALEQVKKRAKAGSIQSRALTSARASTRAVTAGPFTKLRLELTQVKCNERTREVFEKGDEMTFAGVAVLPDLSTKVMGPFGLSLFTSDGQVQTFNPPLEVGTFALGGSFPQTYVVALQACENDGNGGPERIPGLLEEVVAEIKKDVQAALGGGQSTLDQIQDLIKEISEILKFIEDPKTLLDEILKMIGKNDEFFPAQVTGVVIKSNTDPFGGGGAVSTAVPVRFKRTGLLQHGDYTFTFQWAAL